MAKEDKTSLDVVMPVEAREALEAIARERQKSSKYKVYPSDIVREAIQQYFDRLEIAVKVDVDRGGYRGKGAD